MTRLPSLVPVLTGALAASAGALFLLGWHGRPLTGPFMFSAVAIGIVPLLLLLTIASLGPALPTRPPKRRRLPAELPATPYMLDHASYVGGLNDAGLAAFVDAWADTGEWVRPRG